MSGCRYTHIPRPTERKALAAASRSARPLPPVESLLLALLVAYRMRDRHGFALAAHRAVRAVLGDEEAAR